MFKGAIYTIVDLLTRCVRALARFKRAQRSINALYEPPAW